MCNYIIIFFLIVSIFHIINCNSKLENVSKHLGPRITINKYTIAFSGTYGLCISSPPYENITRLSVDSFKDPDWSPDKYWLVGTRENSIWKMNADGSNKIMLSPEYLSSELAHININNEIAFMAYKNADNFSNIYIMNMDGTGLRNITHDLNPGEKIPTYAFPNWSPDGKKIIFKYGNFEPDIQLHQRKIGILDLETRRISHIAAIDSLNPFYPCWSPTGDEFLFVSLRSLDRGGTDIFRANLDGSNIVQLTDDWYSWMPDWAHDGNEILYQGRDETGKRVIKTMNRDGTNKKIVNIGGNNDNFIGIAW